MSYEDEDEIHPGKVLNAPETIYLVIGELDGQDVEFRDLEEISWCDISVYKDDIRYVRATPLVDAAKDLMDALEEVLQWAPTIEMEDKARAAIAKATKGEL